MAERTKPTPVGVLEKQSKALRLMADRHRKSAQGFLAQAEEAEREAEMWEQAAKALRSRPWRKGTR